ncbi:hypothetical protein NPX13_g5866 [Xylaria arbuscula]|uniref:Uncharacterized protein n=1 Tax=Xylaria arbuscula TaxID=114810 RepID=A0A9W8TLZ8_9PEZI|nr:hypothetical protein NPX13_g5866 [Xylaria arbuscula]
MGLHESTGEEQGKNGRTAGAARTLHGSWKQRGLVSGSERRFGPPVLLLATWQLDRALVAASIAPYCSSTCKAHLAVMYTV